MLLFAPYSTVCSQKRQRSAREHGNYRHCKSKAKIMWTMYNGLNFINYNFWARCLCCRSVFTVDIVYVVVCECFLFIVSVSIRRCAAQNIYISYVFVFLFRRFFFFFFFSDLRTRVLTHSLTRLIFEFTSNRLSSLLRSFVTKNLAIFIEQLFAIFTIKMPAISSAAASISNIEMVT